MKKRFNPKVSIVIPVYNGSNYLKEAIDSALAQTYKNIEIIVINDGSNDGGKTDEICKSYGNKIRYYKKENGGVASALNMGIEKMKGEYFSWLSHDDVYYPEKIEKQIKYLFDKGLDKNTILYCDYELINEKGQYLSSAKLDHEILSAKPEYALLRGRINGITLLIPKEAFTSGKRFRENLKYTQDYELWLRLMKEFRFVHMQEVVTKTRIHPEQDSNKHPNAISEGNELWIKMTEQISNERKIELEGTVYNYYREMASFLVTTPYDKALKYVEDKLGKIYEEKRKDIEDIKVSVIIPFYNRIGLLLDSVRSVLEQTHKNLEVLLVNDGSTEDITELVSLVSEDKRIKILTQRENKGPATARNLGIQVAKGKYVSFLDSDDLFVRDKIEIQATLMELTDSKISHTSYIRRGEKKDEYIDTGLIQGDVIPELIGSCPIATPTVMIEAKYLKDKDILFREDFKLGEDVCFWLEILKEEKLLGIERALTIVNTNSSSAANNPEKAIVGISNILSYVLADEELSKYHYKIANLCRLYIDTSEKLKTMESSRQSQGSSFWDRKPQNNILKLLFLFKYQGVSTTIKKIARKYLH